MSRGLAGGAVPSTLAAMHGTPLPRHEPDEAEVHRRWRAFCAERGGISVVGLLLSLVGFLSLIGIPFALFGLYRSLQRRPRFAAQMDLARLGKTPRLVWAMPLMVNRLLRDPQNTTPVPGLFMVAFTPISMPEWGDIGIAVLAPPDDLPEQDRAFCEALMDDEAYQPRRRRKLPMSVTGGREVWAVDLSVPPFYLVGNHVSDEFGLVPCLATPPGGDPDLEVVRVMPYWLLMPDIPPPPFAPRLPVHRG